MADKDNNKSWVDTLSRFLPGIGAVIASVLIPLVIHVNSERNRNNQLYAEIVSKREAADADLRAKMFENLIKGFFGDTSQKKSVKERITLLRLLALNFHESFNLKPLFEGLDSEISGDGKIELRKIAQEIIGKQETMLSQVKEGMVFRETLLEGVENAIMVPHNDKKAYRDHRLGIEVTEIGKDNDYAELHVTDIPAGNTNIGEIANVQFKLTYYDMPFIDNTKLYNNARFAITLKGIGVDEKGRKVVTIKVIFFPETYMSSRDRPYLDEMLEQLRGSNKEV